MLSDVEGREIDAAVQHYVDLRSAAPTVLKIVQRHRRWLSDEALADAGERLDMTVHELDTLATFFNGLYRRPVGRHVILVCDSFVCWALGYEGVRTHVSERLGIEMGQTTADGRFTLLPIVCLGACDHAPAMEIDGELHGDLTPERIAAILERYE